MQLILQSETLSEENRKMSAVGVSEPISGNPLTEEINQKSYSDLKFDGNVTKQMVKENSCGENSSEDSSVDRQETKMAKEVSANGNSKDNSSDEQEIISKEPNDSNENDINDSQSKTHKEKSFNVISNGLENIGENTCNGDVINVNPDERPTNQSENYSENNVANKDPSSLNCDDTGINEKIVADSFSTGLFNEPASKNIHDNFAQIKTNNTVSESLSHETSETRDNNLEQNNEKFSSPPNNRRNSNSENVTTEIDLDSDVLVTNTSKNEALSKEVNRETTDDNSEQNNEELSSSTNTQKKSDSENVTTEIDLDSEVIVTNTSKNEALAKEGNHETTDHISELNNEEFSSPTNTRRSSDSENVTTEIDLDSEVIVTNTSKNEALSIEVNREPMDDNSEQKKKELSTLTNTEKNYDLENVTTEIDLDSENFVTNTSTNRSLPNEINQTDLTDNTCTQDEIGVNIHDEENNKAEDILSKQTDIISNNTNLIEAEKNRTTAQDDIKDTDEQTRLLPEILTPNENLVKMENDDESENFVNNDTIMTSHEQMMVDENHKNTEHNVDVKSEPQQICIENGENSVSLTDDLETNSASNESTNTSMTNIDFTIKTAKIGAENDVFTQNSNENVSDVEINSESVQESDNTTNYKVSSVDTVEVVPDADQSTKDILDENHTESQKSDKNKENELMDVDIENLHDKSKSSTSTTDEKSNNTDSLSVPLEKNSTEAIKEMLRKSTLAQTLDILSDSDDESQSTAINASEKQCIDLIDDDDVMLVDDDCSSDQTEKEVNPSNLNSLRNNTDSSQENTDITTKSDEKNKDNDNHKDAVTAIPEKPLSPSIQSEATAIQNKSDDVQSPYKPKKNVVPLDITSYCKPILSEMTRDQLEEFCLQTIVQGIVDRSYFSEVKTKLKTMMQNAEEWRKKVMMLSKQNRDLQIVLKTIQEEQKKRPTDVIAPLRITRSVGMQVYMVESPRAEAGPGRPRRAPHGGRPRGAAPPAGPAPVAHRPGVRGPQPGAIPVPRLVPASNAGSPAKIAPRPQAPAVTPAFTRPPQPQLQSSAISSNTGRNAPTTASAAAGGASSPAQVPTRPAEKRPLSANGGGGANSVTVDLTDDEPPAKQPARAVGALRVVPQQQLVGPPRASGPRKVYIPISGTQSQPIRPGQTIMFKNIAPPSPRPRNPGGVWTGNMVRLAPRPGLRHPAPLPDAPKQAQPPNWKALPPAPDLKISKVENGIVISWKIDGYQTENWEEIASYQLYAYQETGTAPSTMLWKKIGDVKALPLPMACTLTQFMAGYKYYFAVRAVDIRSRIGPFSLPGSILLLNK